jgi:hypothetical protein
MSSTKIIDMPHKVTLSLSLPSTPSVHILTTSLITESVTLTSDRIRLEGLDPAQYPAAMRTHIDFHTDNHTAIIDRDGPLTVKEVQPTDDPVPATIPPQ